MVHYLKQSQEKLQLIAQKKSNKGKSLSDKEKINILWEEYLRGV